MQAHTKKDDDASFYSRGIMLSACCKAQWMTGQRELPVPHRCSSTGTMKWGKVIPLKPNTVKRRNEMEKLSDVDE